jgi:hypothetical protein
MVVPQSESRGAAGAAVISGLRAPIGYLLTVVVRGSVVVTVVVAAATVRGSVVK